MQDKTFNKYWIVHNGGPTFTNRYKSFDEAAAVAKRNAKQFPGKAFYILEAHSAVVVELPEPTVLFPAPIIES